MKKDKPIKKPAFFRFVCSIVKIFYKKRNFEGIENLPNTPCIIVGNHAQSHGPLSCEFFFPAEKRIWTIHSVMNKKEFPAYAIDDFFPEKKKGLMWFYKSATHITAPLGSYLFRNADTLPVFKDTRIVQTFQLSIQALEDGKNIIIFPENREPFNNIINNFQERYVDLARLYHKKTGKTLEFVPMYNAASLKKVILGKPIKFNPYNNIEDERTKVCNYLKNEITTIAQSLPPHRVVPYENIKKKNYPMSK